MKKRLLFICALLVSVITLSGAANRSFRTEMKQWNPIGFTQATNGMTQAPSGSKITNRLTAGSAILPTVATAATSGVLRGGSTNVITFKTSKKIGESVKLKMTYTGSLSLSGLTGTPKSRTEVIYTLTSQTVTITGDVTYFGCSDNQLKALDVSKNTALTTLFCSNNQLTELDVSKNSKLTDLTCRSNPLTALDVSKNTELTTFICWKNQLTALDVSKNTALTWLDCSYNQLTALDVSKNTALRTLDCSYNQLTALDVSQNTALTSLDCSYNQLAALDVSKYTELGTLNCRSNQIKGEEMTRLVNSLPDRTGKDAGEFTVVQEPAPEGNICLKSDVAIAKGKNWNTLKYKTDTHESIPYEGAELIMSFTTAKAVGEKISLYMEYSGAAPTLSGATGTPKSGIKVTYTLTSQTVTITGGVTFLDCSGNQLTTLDVSKNTALTTLDCDDNQLTALDVSQNTAFTKLSCSNNQLTALDLSQNTALKFLYCTDNQLTALNLSKNTALADLNCCNNQLTALDVSKNTALKGLGCFNNQLTTLDVSKNTALTQLFCNNNQLTALDVSKNTALTMLFCFNNQLTTLDVSQNTSLTWFFCSGNQIKGKEMTRLVNSLPDRMGKGVGTFTVVHEPDLEGNICLKSDVAIAKGKNWNTKKYKSDTHDVVDYEGAEPIPYAVTLTKEGEGTLTATGAADLNAVPEGTELTIEATPAAGYELKALTANGADILATKKFTVTANTEVKATFTKKTAADVVESGALRLYPNPASAYVNVKGAKADALVRLYDANGTLRYEARTDADGTLQIDLSAYAEGTYLLLVDSNAQRLLIQR